MKEKLAAFLEDNVNLRNYCIVVVNGAAATEIDTEWIVVSVRGV